MNNFSRTAKISKCLSKIKENVEICEVFLGIVIFKVLYKQIDLKAWTLEVFAKQAGRTYWKTKQKKKKKTEEKVKNKMENNNFSVEG